MCHKEWPSSSSGYCGLSQLLGCLEGSEGEVVRPRSSFTGQPILSPVHDDRELFKYRVASYAPVSRDPLSGTWCLSVVPRQHIRH